MKYLLTKEELDALGSKAEYEKIIKDMEDALEWCRKKLMQEGCLEKYTYCDNCPISSIGNDQDISWDISHKICYERRQYSK